MPAKKTQTKARPAHRAKGRTKSTVTQDAVPSKGASSKTLKAAWAAAQDEKRTLDQRCTALLSMGRSVLDDPQIMQGVLNLINEQQAPLPLRLNALRLVQAASFSAIKFNRFRPVYLTALRKAATDPDMELRQRAFGMLAREKDGSAQEQLMEGLNDPAKALLPPEKALQLLSYDIHSGAYEAARKIVEQPPNHAAKREALRVLAADASSADLFEGLLRDKTESPEIRQMCAAALQTIAPGKLQDTARDILMDQSDNDEIRAASLTAMTHFGNENELAKDEAVLQQADQLLEGETHAEPLKQSAQQLLRKYRR